MTDRVKRDARARQAATGEPYARARREVARQAAIEAKDVPGAGDVPQPVAVMLARHLRAALMHLSTWGRLAEGARALPRDSGVEKPSGPAAPILEARHAALMALLDLEQWSERTALESGAIPALPDLIGPGTPGGKAAALALYPQREGIDGWCAEEGGRMPQPGEDRAGGEGDGPDARRVRHCLPGPVPSWHLTANSEGRDVRRARDVVPGTPAAPIWDSASRLYGYACGWMDRPGDSPADLAAALDGLEELATTFADVTGQLLGEIARRIEDGTLDGTDAARLAGARASLDQVLADPAGEGWTRNRLRGAIGQARAAITGATARPAAGTPAPPAGLARQMAGKAPVQVRDEAGKERFYQRQRSRTRPTDYTRADHLEAILTWMHATGAAAYDPAAHAGAPDGGQ